jgi:DNA-dependent protein kinase catalytic subunit
LWENGRLECFAQLTRWQDLAENTLAEVGNPQNLWQGKYIDPYLRHFIVSHLKQKERWPELLSFFDQQEGQHREMLEHQFSPELAFMSIARDDLDRARFYVIRSFQQFLAKWTSLHPLANAARHQALQPLQKVVEMEEFLSFVADGRNFETMTPVNTLLGNMRSRWPSPRLDNVLVWDNVVSNRSVLLDKLNDRFALYTSRSSEAVTLLFSLPFIFFM